MVKWRGTLEDLVKKFWDKKKVFITGHTGFKGSWLCLALNELGAEITGYSLEPPTNPSLFSLLNLSERMHDYRGDIRDIERLDSALNDSQPEIVFHLAAQPIVLYSYKNPVETYEVNFNGTLNLLEAIRHSQTVKSAVLVTTDKCYENTGKKEGYVEEDSMGGYDPYSSSKGAAEILISSYRRSFFSNKSLDTNRPSIASARAGNVIGGGDWAEDRLVPDVMKSILNKDKAVTIRNPKYIRPWQHVLEPTFGYIKLAEYLYKYGEEYEGGWNFGPDLESEKDVEWIVSRLLKLWGGGIEIKPNKEASPHEASYLKLDCSKAKEQLNWQPLVDIEETLVYIIDWYKGYEKETSLKDITEKQIRTYINKQK